MTKWGNLIDEPNRQLVGVDSSPAYLRTALDASLARLRTDRVDLYLLHLSGLPADQAIELLGALQALVVEGKIGAYGWSTDDPALATAWVGQPGFGAIEFEANVVNDAPGLVTICDDHELPGLVRAPLATGLLGGGPTPRAHRSPTPTTSGSDHRTGCTTSITVARWIVTQTDCDRFVKFSPATDAPSPREPCAGSLLGHPISSPFPARKPSSKPETTPRHSNTDHSLRQR